MLHAFVTHTQLANGHISPYVSMASASLLKHFTDGYHQGSTVQVKGSEVCSDSVSLTSWSGTARTSSTTASNVTVSEGAATLDLTAAVGAFTVADSDDNGAATFSATITVSQGTISAVGGSGGTVSGTGTATVTLTGATEAQLNARLQALTVTYPDEAGSPTGADWNGNFTVTVVVNDGGSTGQEPSDGGSTQTPGSDTPHSTDPGPTAGSADTGTGSTDSGSDGAGGN